MTFNLLSKSWNSLFIQRNLHSSSIIHIKRNQLPARPRFTAEMESQCEEVFLHGGRGPGGQKINKCNSKVQLRHIPSGTVVTCQETRSRARNRDIARLKMAQELDSLYNHGGANPRDEALRQLAQQNKRSKIKRSQIKYRLHREMKEAKMAQQLKEDQLLLQSLLKEGSGQDD